MKVLFDTNVIIDIWKKDPWFFQESFCSYDVCMLREWDAYLAVTTLPDIEYLLSARSILPKSEVPRVLDALMEMFRIADAQECDCKAARQSEMKDFEDAIIAYSAKRNGIDFIVTRNIKDFEKAPVPSMTPDRFVKDFAPSGVSYSEIPL